MTRKILGLDLRDHSVAAVVVTHGRRGFRIEAHAHVPVTPSEGGGSGLKDALKILIDSVDPAGCVCAVSIPPGLASFRNFRVPFNHPKKIRQVLPFELEPALPYPVDDVSIGFQVLDLPGEDASVETELLLAVVENSRLQAYIDALAAVKIRPETVTVGGYAAARWMASGQMENDLLLVDVDGSRCAVFALSRGEVIMGRAFSTGLPGSTSEDALSTRICQTCRAAQDALPREFTPQAGIVAGGGSRGRSLAPVLSEALGISITRTDFSGGTETAGIAWDAARMDNALALALAEAGGLVGINFRPAPLGIKKLWAENRSSMIRTALLAAAALVVVLAGVLADAYTKQSRLDSLNRRIATVFAETFPEVQTVVDPLQQMRANVQEARRKAGLSQSADEQMRAVNILREISVRIPRGIDVDFGQTMIGPEGVRVSGSTGGFDSVDRIKNSLSGIPGFSSVSITSATVEKSGGRVRFKLKMTP